MKILAPALGARFVWSPEKARESTVQYHSTASLVKSAEGLLCLCLFFVWLKEMRVSKCGRMFHRPNLNPPSWRVGASGNDPWSIVSASIACHTFMNHDPFPSSERLSALALLSFSCQFTRVVVSPPASRPLPPRASIQTSMRSSEMM
ncbi:hypothetical protein BDW62DRAFT_70680 [Aspergillus aurantiobrunneus]